MPSSFSRLFMADGQNFKTSLTLVSQATAAAIHENIAGSVIDPDTGIWRLPCSIHNHNNVMRNSADESAEADASNNVPSSSTHLTKYSKWALGGWHLRKRAAHSLPISSSSPRDFQGGQFHTRATGRPTNSSPNIFFEFGVGTSKFAIPAEDLAYQSSAPDGSSVSDMCYSGIQAGGDEFVVLGDIFIKVRPFLAVIQFITHV